MLILFLHKEFSRQQAQRKDIARETEMTKMSFEVSL